MRMYSFGKEGLKKDSFFGKVKGFSVTSWIIIVNIVVFMFLHVLVFFYPNILSYFFLQPSNFFQGKYVWTLITHMFSHVLFFHLFFNMVSLWFVGRFVERIIGRKRFFWFYISSGIFAGMLSVVLSGFFGYGFWEKVFSNPLVPMLGASGAIFGVVGLLAALIPRGKVYLIMGPLIAIIIQLVINSVFQDSGLTTIIILFINVYIIFSIFAMFSFNARMKKFAFPIAMSFWVLPFVAIIPLVIIGLFVPLPIGNVAHFGGFMAGIIYGGYLRVKYRRKVFLLQRYFR